MHDLLGWQQVSEGKPQNKTLTRLERCCRLAPQTLCLPLGHVAMRLEQLAGGSWPVEAPSMDSSRVAACLRQVGSHVHVRTVRLMLFTC